MKISQEESANKNWWNKLEIGCKFILFIVVLFSIFNIFIEQLSQYLINDIRKTVQQFQIWRIVTSFLIPAASSNFSTISVSLIIIIKLTINLYILTKIAHIIERQYSTAYFVINSFLQILAFNTAVIVIYYPLIVFGYLSQSFAYGIFPLIMNFLWQSIAFDENITMKIIFMTYVPKFKYIAIVILALQLVVQHINGGMIMGNIMYVFLAYYQHIIRKRLFLTLPLSVYQHFDAIIPQKIKSFKAYTKVQDVLFELQPNCSKGLFDQNLQQKISDTQTSSLSSKQTNKKALTKFKAHWQNKYKDTYQSQQPTKTKPQQDETIKKQINPNQQSLNIQNKINNQIQIIENKDQTNKQNIFNLNKQQILYQKYPQNIDLNNQNTEQLQNNNNNNNKQQQYKNKIKQQYDDDQFI